MSIAIGDKFGCLTVIESCGRTKQYKRSRPVFKVCCDCGNIFKIFGNELKKGSQTRKGCLKCKAARQRCVKPGEKYDKLTVIKYIKPNNKRTMVVCKCDCGQTITIRPNLLSYNKTNNCGCSPRGHYKGYEKISGVFLYRLKCNAEVRNIEYNISPEYLWQLFQEQNGCCALSGQKLTFKPKTASVDRIDSSIGYVEGNIQWVHKRLNIMKASMSNQEFVDICKMVVDTNC